MDHPAIARALEREGRITFARYMQMALYHPRWGYYSRQVALGESGDFYTSPELHPLFAASVAARAHAVWRALGSPERFDFAEAGGGSGRFARDFLLYVDDCFPELGRALRYRIDDRGASLRKSQRQRLTHAGLDRRVRWTDASPASWATDSVHGMVLANELLDALSVHLVTARDGEIRELYVRSSKAGLALEPGPVSTPRLAQYLESIGIAVPDGVQWEVNLNTGRWIRRATRSLAAGALLLIDYGHSAPDLYSPNRAGGTLLCYSRHTVHSNPLRNPGGEDITSHVDLTTVRTSLASAGFTVVEDCPQTDALGAQAVREWRGWTLGAEADWTTRTGLARSLEALSDPDGLGRLQWILGVKPDQPNWEMTPPEIPLPASTRLLDDHLVLPDPAMLDFISDVEGQWRQLWSGEDD